MTAQQTDERVYFGGPTGTAENLPTWLAGGSTAFIQTAEYTGGLNDNWVSFNVLEADPAKLKTYDGNLKIYDRDGNVRQVPWSLYMYQIVLTDAPYQAVAGSYAVLQADRFKVPRQRYDYWGNQINT